MKIKMLLSLFALLSIYLLSVDNVGAAKPNASETYPFDVDLAPNDRYHLYWKHGNGNITFEVIVKTTNWIGLGFSTNGKMRGADIVTGSHNKELVDRHGSLQNDGHVAPIKDEQQDYHLDNQQLTDGWTVLKFTRKINTCDKNDISNLAEGTVRVIWAIGKSPSFAYHGADNRGSRSVSLIAPVKHVQLESDIKTFDVLNQNFTLPAGRRTTYWCTAVGVKQLGITERYQIVKYEPKFTEGNMDILHHIVLYWCYHTVNENFHGYGHRCYTRNMPDDMKRCRSATLAWAVGEREFNFPKETGMSIGGPNDANFFLMEVHYDNPKMTERKDSSGIKLYLTKKFRQYEASMLMVGRNSDTTLQVPPKDSSFWATSQCPHACLDAGLDSVTNGTIKVFANLLHTHLAGRQIRSYHIRNGEEIGSFGRDDLYDFNFQETRLLDPPQEIQKGDDIVVECGYETMDRDKVTKGGLGSPEEMCYNFMLYYPKMTLASCFTIPALWQSVSPGQLNWQDALACTEPLASRFTPSKTQSGYYIRKFYELQVPQKWNKELRDLFQYFDAASESQVHCNKFDNTKLIPMFQRKPIEVTKYLPQHNGCPNKNTTYNKLFTPEIKSDEEANVMINKVCIATENANKPPTTTTKPTNQVSTKTSPISSASTSVISMWMTQLLIMSASASAAILVTFKPLQ